jgi:amidase
VAALGAAALLPNAALAKTSFSEFDGLGLAELIRRKETSAAELLSWAIANAEAINPRINCLAHAHYDKARAQITAGLPEGPFRGVPFLIKDLNTELAGTITSAGSLAFKDHIASVDSELVSRYKRAGLVIFGKTTSPEL